MSEQEKISKEQLILDAAEHEFLTKGYDGARTTSIAERAGVTHAMLHYYFRTKEHLFECVVEKTTGLIGETIFAAMGNPNKPLIERLKEGIGAHFDLIKANPLLPRFFLNEFVLRPERYNILSEHINNIAKLLFTNLQNEADAAAERGEIERIDIRLLLMSIVSLNVFPFLAYNFIEPIMGDLMSNKDEFLATRRAENIETIMKRIIKK